METRHLLEACYDLWGAAFARRVVHPSAGRFDAAKQDRVAAALFSVSARLEEIDLADEIRRANELHLLIPRQITSVKEPEVSVFHTQHHTLRVFTPIFCASGRRRALGVRPTCLRKDLAV